MNAVGNYEQCRTSTASWMRLCVIYTFIVKHRLTLQGPIRCPGCSLIKYKVSLLYPSISYPIKDAWSPSTRFSDEWQLFKSNYLQTFLMSLNCLATMIFSCSGSLFSSRYIASNSLNSNTSFTINILLLIDMHRRYTLHPSIWIVFCVYVNILAWLFTVKHQKIVFLLHRIVDLNFRDKISRIYVAVVPQFHARYVSF